MAYIDPKKLEAAADPQFLAGYLAALPEADMHEHPMAGMAILTREDSYKKHNIVIHTSYRIAVDGQEVRVPMMIDHEGHVHCHSLPNYRFTSVVDLVRQLIDTFPNEFA